MLEAPGPAHTATLAPPPGSDVPGGFFVISGVMAAVAEPFGRDPSSDPSRNHLGAAADSFAAAGLSLPGRRAA